MSIYQRGNIWWANFTVRGMRYQFSTGQQEKKKAQEWERRKIADMHGESSAVAVLEKIKVHLAEKQATFQQAWDFFTEYPRRTTPSAPLLKYYNCVWFDLAAFAADRGISFVAELDDRIATVYTSEIRERGRYTGKDRSISARTVNHYIATLKMIFSVLEKGKFIVQNPFGGIEKMAHKRRSREIFTEQEIDELLRFKDHPLYPVVLIGNHTGLRLGDIARLGWDDIDFTSGWIGRDQNKTSYDVRIPLDSEVKSYLQSLPKTSVYCFPELEERYRNDAPSISVMFKQMLRKAGITGAVCAVPGRSRRQSVKDIHSLRHTFAYTAGKAGIPFPIVQSILGHMTPEMTRHYMAHATDRDKKAAWGKLSRKDDKARVRRLVELANPQNIESLKRHLLRIL